MSYVAPFLDASGLHIPMYNDVLQYMIAQYKGIFGQDVYIGQDTQDYQLLSLYASLWDDMATVVIDSYNARNVNWATGTQLDLLVAMSGIKRLSATYSTVTLNLTGTPNTTLQAGATARDTNGYSWEIVGDCTFDSNGEATALAKCTQSGCIVAGAGTITVCQTPTYNWLSVTNQAAATTGSDQQSDAELKQRRSKILYSTSASAIDSLVSSIRSIDNVTAVKITQNNGNTTDSNGVPAHSICCIVQGGSNDQIAEAIYLKRSPGIGTHGSTTVNYTDRWGQNVPIKFSRPTTKSVNVRIDITALDGFDSVSTPQKIKSSIRDYIQNIDIGTDLNVPYLYAQAYSVLDGAPTFVITSATANNKTSTVQADFGSRFAVGSIEVNVT